ncbi:hypothetical protein HZA56_11835 [Candidatus Poribacteria bacterium]|nr:hypothetical protein [Candidatus Poribacteria bacterium]
MRSLKKTYGEKYSFSFDGERFLSVKPKKNAPVNKDELIEIYKAFFLDKNGKPRESSIYTHLMNYYGHEHEFHQLQYFPSEGRVKVFDSDAYRGKREPLTARSVVEFWGRQFKRLFD